MHIGHLSFRHFFTFSPFFRPFSVNFSVAFKTSLSASNKCVLPIFLSVTFHALLALFFRPFLRRILSLISVNFYITFKPNFTKMFLINAYCPSFFLSLFHFSRPFSAFFPSPLRLALHDSNKSYYLSFFPSLSSPSRPFSPFSPSHLNIASHASNKFVLPIFLSATFLAFPPLNM
jgi:hypothetical protein